MTKEVKIKIDGPFLISSKEQRPGYVHAFPYAWKLPDGRIFLIICKERDIFDGEHFMLVSNDLGKTWKDCNDWPIAEYPCTPPRFFVFDNHNLLAVMPGSFFVNKKKGGYTLPTWFSKDGGNSWGSMQACKMQVPCFTEPIDIYDPPEWWLKKNKSLIEHGFIKPEPPESLTLLFKKFSRKRGPGISRIVRISGKHLVGLISVGWKKDRYSSVAALESKDGGCNWRFLSMVARYRPKYTDKSIGEEDGFCEPSIVKLPGGELLAILRMGSFYPLYAVRSEGNGKTWSTPEQLSVRGVSPQAIILKNGIVALSTGRPDVTLNLSIDRGYHWPYQVKILEYSNTSKCSLKCSFFKHSLS